MTYGISITLTADVDSAIRRTRDALADHGFGVLTEINVHTTLHDKLGVEVAPHVILGACRPQLAYRALAAEPAIGLLLPCNVVVRSVGEGMVEVAAVDPQIMLGVTANAELEEIAAEARERLSAAIASLGEEVVTSS